jgi:hypothetical protein
MTAAARRQAADRRERKTWVSKRVSVRPKVAPDEKDKVRPAEWSNQVREFLEECDYSQG